MPRKTMRVFVALLGILGLATLSCKAPYYVLRGDPSQFPQNVSGLLCETTNGTWIENADGTGVCDKTHPQAAGNDQQNDEGAGIDQQNDPGAGNSQQNDQGHVFSVDDCSCAGVNIPLKTELSSASNKSTSLTLETGEQIQTTGYLTCDWQAVYQSEHKTGTILLYLTVTKLDNIGYANALFSKSSLEVKSKPQYCEDDEECSVAVTEFSGDRAFYAWKEIHIEPDGTELPSSHFANLARLVDTGNDVFYVLDLMVSHPELEMSDNWVIDVSRSVEACVMDFAK
jgi:hypothetical protein